MRAIHYFVTVLFIGIGHTLIGDAAEIRVTVDDAARKDEFGFSVGISGDYAIVGAPQRLGSGSGAAYIFQRNGNDWIQQQRLTTSNAVEESNFGAVVAIDGDYAIVGARASAHIFMRSGDIWVKQAKIDDFGHAVAISGDVVVIGEPRDINVGHSFGAAYVYQRNGSSWIQQAMLTANDAVESQQFGHCVDVSGDTVIVGAYWDRTVEWQAGAVYIFARNDNSWTQQAKLIVSDALREDYFGYSVAIDGNTAIVGATQAFVSAILNTGKAYVFVRNGNNWILQQKLRPSDGDFRDQFGWTVAISGNFAFVGSRLHDIRGASSAGATYSFLRTGSSWTEAAKQVASDASSEEVFGFSVDINRNFAIVGKPGDDEAGIDSGAAYIYPVADILSPVDLPMPVYIRSDVNKDGSINILDLVAIAKYFGTKQSDANYNTVVDVDKNGSIDILDLVAVAKDFGISAAPNPHR